MKPQSAGCNIITPTGNALSPAGSPVRKFLFEDDYQFSQLLGTLFPAGVSAKFSQRAVYTSAVGVFGVLFALMAELSGWQQLKTGGQPAASDGAGGESATEESSAGQTAFGGLPDTQDSLVSGSNWLAGDQNYTFASMLDMVREPGAEGRSETSGPLVMAQNAGPISSAGFSAGSFQSGFGGGGVGGGGGGSGGGPGPAAQIVSAVPSVGTVPEVGRSAALLVLGLAAMFAGRYLIDTVRSLRS